jgi:hypothetical protein
VTVTKTKYHYESYVGVQSTSVKIIVPAAITYEDQVAPVYSPPPPPPPKKIPDDKTACETDKFSKDFSEFNLRKITRNMIFHIFMAAVC